MAARELDPAQQMQLARVREAHALAKVSKADIEKRIRDAVQEEVQSLNLNLALAVRRAHDLGIPILRISREGLGTTDRTGTYKLLGKTARLVELQESPAFAGKALGGPFAWADDDKMAVKVEYPSFPTRLTAEDYPAVLEGVARPSSTVRSGWEVVTDPGTISTDFGPLEGLFTVELRDGDPDDPSSLPALLNKWLKEARKNA